MSRLGGVSTPDMVIGAAVTGVVGALVVVVGVQAGPDAAVAMTVAGVGLPVVVAGVWLLARYQATGAGDGVE